MTEKPSNTFTKKYGRLKPSATKKQYGKLSATFNKHCGRLQKEVILVFKLWEKITDPDLGFIFSLDEYIFSRFCKD